MRLLIIGSSGSGKSSLARKLSQKLQLPCLHLDKVWHATDYSEAARVSFLAELDSFMTSHQDWIIDGNYSFCLPQRLTQADQVIWLELPRYKTLYRVLKRSLLHRLKPASRPDMPENFREQLNKDYLDFLAFVWSFPSKQKPRLEAELASFQGQVSRVTSQKELENLLKSLDQA